MKLANPAPLGLFGFALTTWLLAIVNAGWFGANALPLVMAMGFAFGGATQFCAGLCELPRGDTFGFTAFAGFGAFWFSYALFVGFYSANVPPTFVAWYLFVWAIFTFVLWIGTFSANRALQMVFLTSWIMLALLASAEWSGLSVLHQIGGYVGMITAALAFYLATAQVIDEARGADVLPLGIYPKRIATATPATVAARVVL